MPRPNRGGKSRGGPKKPSLTHFLITRFRNDVCQHGQTRSTDDKGQTTTETEASDDAVNTSTVTPIIAEKAVRPIGALHLTLGVMSLDHEKLQQAIQHLQSLDIRRMLQQVSKLSKHQSQSTADQATPIPSKGVAVSTGRTVERSGSISIPSTLSRPISPPPTSEKDTPLKISLESLRSMHAPHKTSILYALAQDPSERLEPLCNALRDQFMKAGFLIKDQRPLKLHATIVNTIYAKGRKRTRKPREQTNGQQRNAEVDEIEGKEPTMNAKTKGSEAEAENDKAQEPTIRPADQAVSNEEKVAPDDGSTGHGPNANAPLKINAVEILERYKDYVWANDFVLDRVAICEMGAKKILNDKGEVLSEEYKEVATLSLPR
ncbi:hypothetical protein MBLNU457_g2599t1 [Dothideomycetes sp. NU457]